MNLNSNNIVQLKNGKRGVVSTILGKAWLVVFANFTIVVSKFDEDLNHQNKDYSIEKVWECKDDTYDFKKVWNKSFDESELELVFERKE